MKNLWINAENNTPKDKSLWGKASKDVLIKISEEYKRKNEIKFDGNYLIGQYWHETACFRTGLYLPTLYNMEGLFWMYCD